ncbi:ribonuclease [Undibacterium sp. TJN25]|uniref:ribonuclease n=1 Tax=Undibacterium sp. TJN25 TaxID=3413056 RepID=UPI003BF00597
MIFNASFLKKWIAFVAMLVLSVSVFAREAPASGTVAVTDLPREAQVTLAAIKQGGPFAYDKDGVVFGNYESRLPRQKRGYYHEYTVKTPRARNRGARRIIAGGEPRTSGEYYYTDDHYETFRKIKE